MTVTQFCAALKTDGCQWFQYSPSEVSVLHLKPLAVVDLGECMVL